MVNSLIKNPFNTTLEELLWSAQHLGQILLDLKIVQSEDLKVKREFDFLQKVARLHDQLLASLGNWSKIQKVIGEIMPVTTKGWWYSNVRKQDWTVLKSEIMNTLVDNDSMPVPKFRLLPENYR